MVSYEGSAKQLPLLRLARVEFLPLRAVVLGEEDHGQRDPKLTNFKISGRIYGDINAVHTFRTPPCGG